MTNPIEDILTTLRRHYDDIERIRRSLNSLEYADALRFATDHGLDASASYAAVTNITDQLRPVYGRINHIQGRLQTAEALTIRWLDRATESTYHRQ